MTTKNGNGKNVLALTESLPDITAQELADEIKIGVDDLLPILAKMGLKNPTKDSIVKGAIARNARMAVEARNRAIDAAKPEPVQMLTLETPEETKAAEAAQEKGGELDVAQTLKPSQVKEVAKATGLTQAIVRKLDQALFDRECQLLFLEGFSKAQKEDQQRSALEMGELAYKLQQIQERDKALDEREAELIEQGTSEVNHPAAIALSFGIDVDGILAELEQSETERAAQRLASEDVSTDGLNPFSVLLKKRQAK